MNTAGKWAAAAALALSAGLAVSLGAGAAMAQSGADFFKGKIVNYIVATDAGGVYDTNGRLVAEFMQKHLPGSTFVVRNMPGAGSIIGANYIYASKPDGLTIGTFNTGLIYAQLVGNPSIQFRLEDMSWIGKVASDPRVLFTTAASGIGQFGELRALKTPAKFATCGVGCASMLESTMLISSFGLPINLISGYNGNEDQLALRRGEVQGLLASRSEFEQMVAEGQGLFIAQIGGGDADVPQLASFAETEFEQAAVKLVESQGELSRLTAGPPGIPEDRLEALREAYRAATSDPAFIQRAAALRLPVNPEVGESVASRIRGALDQSPETVAFLKQALGAK